MSEMRLRHRMRNGLVSSCFIQLIENLIGEGVPDVALHCRKTGVGAWVELKYRPYFPVRNNTPIFKGKYGARSEQKAWIHERSLAGALIWILAQCDQQLWLIHGRHVRNIEDMDLQSLNYHCAWNGKARATDWNIVKQKIFGE